MFNPNSAVVGQIVIVVAIILMIDVAATRLYHLYRQVWRKEEWKNYRPPTDFTIQILDHNKIPVRTSKLTNRTASGLIRQIDEGWYSIVEEA